MQPRKNMANMSLFVQNLSYHKIMQINPVCQYFYRGHLDFSIQEITRKIMEPWNRSMNEGEMLLKHFKNMLCNYNGNSAIVLAIYIHAVCNNVPIQSFL